ncbi:hypothetical protein TSOC_007171 [Tetrabaena socialis]|uniref:Uncharacterized protein n=1 Tax=Tetrabaena socialis TaxID=47790 RepID=A0A2J8A1U7_9CHLO|nr:hypothetical protein TSOC_007171 [Tetrabaena socialis]|eukprot:PNH06482.1 hypothetical protein TSOC_007171 [Tetrabaena socialis]
MPRQRQRIVYCDCFDCVDRPEQPSLTPAQLDAATAVARQEPPPKALLLYASGLLLESDGATTLDACTLPHCNLLVREGNLGLLAVRRAAGSDAPHPALEELSQLLGCAHQGAPMADGPAGADGGGGGDAAGALPSIAARFKGMQAAFASTSAPACALADRLGMAVVPRLCLRPGGGGGDGGGVGGGAAEGASGRDLLLLHLDLTDLVAAAARWDAGCEALEWLDALVKGLLALPEIRERTFLVLMLSPGGQRMPSAAATPGGGVASGSGGLLQPGGAQLDPAAGIVTPRNATQVGRGAATGAAAAAAAGGGAPAGLSVLDADDLGLVTRPVQSFEFAGLERVAVDAHAPVLVSRRLPGVVRRDRAERLGYKDALASGGQGCILLERLLPEVAYKIGRAPKYGA